MLAVLMLLFSMSVLSALPKWTILVYLDADNNLEGAGVVDVNEMETIGSTADFNIVVQMDRASGEDSSNGNWTECRRAKIVKDTNSTTMTSFTGTNYTSLGEVNMGDANTLKSFIQWGMATYPAENYMLVLWNHGGGWRSVSSPLTKAICWDDASGGDCLYTKDLSTVLAACDTSKLRIIGFDACLMGMVEVAYQVRSFADVMVGSEETEPGDGWPYHTILADLKANPSMTAAQLGTVIVDRYGEFYTNDSVTQSALDLTKIDAVVTAIDAFSTSAMADSSAWSAVTTARTGAGTYEEPDYKDIWGWSNSLASGSTSLKSYAQTIQTALENAVIRNYSTASLKGHGLSIYFPKGTVDAEYKAINIDFAADTSWDEFLKAYGSGSAPVTAPANNNFASAITMTGDNGSLNGSNVSATKETGEPNHDGNAGGVSVWWKWVAPSDGSLSVDTHGSNFDTVMGVYTGSSVSALTKKASNDDDGSSNSNSGVSISNVVSGTTYYVAIDGYSAKTGSIKLNWNFTSTASVPVATTATSLTENSFTANWNAVLSATEYRLDVATSNSFSSGSGGTLISEDFTNGVSSNWVDTGTSTDATHPGIASPSRAFGPEDSLETPAVNNPSRITFFTDASSSGSGKTADIEYKIGSGSWTKLKTFTVSTTGTTEDIDLTQSPNLSSSQGVAFRFTSTFSTWYLDDVTVTGSSGTSTFVTGFQDRNVGNVTSYSVTGLETGITYYYRVRAIVGTTTANSNIVSATTVGSAVAPSIQTQPASETILSGESRTLTVSANGTGPLTYAWYQGTSGNTAVTVGTNASSFTTPALTETTAYWVRVTNSEGSEDSVTATLTVGSSGGGTAPVITAQPATHYVSTSGTAILNVVATGSDPKHYYWYRGIKGDTSVPVGSDAPSFTAQSLTASTPYWVKISNGTQPDAISETAMVIVTPTGSTPGVGGSEDFSNCTSTSGSYVNGTFTGNNGGTWSYTNCRWDTSIQINGKTPCLAKSATSRIDSSTISGGIGTLSFKYKKPYTTAVSLDVYANATKVATVTTTETNVIKDSGNITVNQTGDVVISFRQSSSSSGQVSIDDIVWTGHSTGVTAPVITTHPSSQSVTLGNTVTLSVTATGTGPLTYLWYRGNAGDTTNLVSISNSNTYSTPALQTTTSYWVKIVNGASSFASSNTATITPIQAGATFNSWITSKSLTDSSPTADPDGDGIANIVEYAVDGMEPDAVNSMPQIVYPSQTPSGEYLEYNLSKRPDTNVVLRIEFSTDLVTWNNASVIADGDNVIYLDQNNILTVKFKKSTYSQVFVRTVVSY